MQDAISTGNITVNSAGETTAENTPAVTDTNELTSNDIELDPHMAIRERKITVMYRFPDVSKREVKLIVEYWNSGAAMMNIMRRLQPQRVNNKQPPLTYVDIYSILYTLALEKKVTQRSTNMDELTLNDFAAFFRIWKQGGSLKECLKGITERLSPACVRYAQLVFRSLGDRYRAEQKAINASAKRVDPRDHLMEVGIRRKVDGKDAIVVFLNDIPKDLLWQLRKFANGLKYDPSMKTGSDVFDNVIKNPHQPILQSKPPAPESLNPFEDQKQCSDTDDEDLDILDPTGQLEELGTQRKAERQAEKEQRKRLGYGRQADPNSVQSSQSVQSPPQPAVRKNPFTEPFTEEETGDLETLLAGNSGVNSNINSSGNSTQNLTLENLNDDDPIDP